MHTKLTDIIDRVIVSLSRSKEKQSSKYHFVPVRGQQKPALCMAPASSSIRVTTDMGSTQPCKCVPCSALE